MTEFTDIRYEVAEGLATITLNRPDRMNVINMAVISQIIAALDAADADDKVRAILFASTGKNFCAGADLSPGIQAFDYESQADNSVTSPINADGSIDYSHEQVRDGAGLLTLRLFRCLKPVVGAIQGAAVGVGVTMTLAMDVRFAAEDARFGFVFTRRGIVPEGASSWFLPRLVGLPVALDWALSGRMISAGEALEAGLLRAVVPAAELPEAALAWAREIRDNTSGVSVALTRQMLWQMAGADHPMAAHRIDSRGVYACGRNADAREGVAAFLERRPPQFQDSVSTQMPDFFPWWDEPPYS